MNIFGTYKKFQQAEASNNKDAPIHEVVCKTLVGAVLIFPFNLLMIYINKPINILIIFNKWIG
jgi:hypothetical protein